MIIETPIRLNLDFMNSQMGGDYFTLSMLAETFPAGRALLVNHDGDEFIATTQGNYWGDVPPAHFYKVLGNA